MNIFTKKIICSTLTVVLAVSLALTGCGKKQGAGELADRCEGGLPAIGALAQPEGLRALTNFAPEKLKFLCNFTVETEWKYEYYITIRTTASDNSGAVFLIPIQHKTRQTKGFIPVPGTGPFLAVKKAAGQEH